MSELCASETKMLGQNVHVTPASYKMLCTQPREMHRASFVPHRACSRGHTNLVKVSSPKRDCLKPRFAADSPCIHGCHIVPAAYPILIPVHLCRNTNLGHGLLERNHLPGTYFEYTYASKSAASVAGGIVAAVGVHFVVVLFLSASSSSFTSSLSSSSSSFSSSSFCSSSSSSSDRLGRSRHSRGHHVSVIVVIVRDFFLKMILHACFIIMLLSAVRCQSCFARNPVSSFMPCATSRDLGSVSQNSNGIRALRPGV